MLLHHALVLLRDLVEAGAGHGLEEGAARALLDGGDRLLAGREVRAVLRLLRGVGGGLLLADRRGLRDRGLGRLAVGLGLLERLLHNTSSNKHNHSNHNNDNSNNKSSNKTYQ